ncbi:MAG TPA: hypothetical protein VGO00_15835, partial [Kofleriaceae bacterium]|nr:hypothetical protein [Kofleriaceae bacterium]
MSDDRSGYLPPHEIRALFGQVQDAGGAVPTVPAPSIASSTPGLASTGVKPINEPTLPFDQTQMMIAISRIAGDLLGTQSLSPVPLSPQHGAMAAASTTPPSPGMAPALVTPTPPGGGASDPTVTAIPAGVPASVIPMSASPSPSMTPASPGITSGGVQPIGAPTLPLDTTQLMSAIARMASELMVPAPSPPQSSSSDPTFTAISADVPASVGSQHASTAGSPYTSTGSPDSTGSPSYGPGASTGTSPSAASPYASTGSPHAAGAPHARPSSAGSTGSHAAGSQRAPSPGPGASTGSSPSAGSPYAPSAGSPSASTTPGDATPTFMTIPPAPFSMAPSTAGMTDASSMSGVPASPVPIPSPTYATPALPGDPSPSAVSTSLSP